MHPTGICGKNREESALIAGNPLFERGFFISVIVPSGRSEAISVEIIYVNEVLDCFVPLRGSWQ